MIQNTNVKETSSFQNYLNEPISEKNNNINGNLHLHNKKMDNEIQSNSGTSFSSNKDPYNNMISKIKLKYNLNYPQGRTQTIILRTSLDKSLNSINNDSILENNNNNIFGDGHTEEKEPSLNTDNNNNTIFTGGVQNQINKGFMLDNSFQNSNKKNTLNNNNDINNSFNDQNIKRDALNYLNKLYEGKIEDDYNNNNNNNIDINKPTQLKKDNFTINFNNNMFFVNDSNNNNNNNEKMAQNIFTSFKPTGEESFKDKVFASQNEFLDKYPGLNNGDNNDNKNNYQFLPYGYQNNPFCNQNQNNNNNNVFPQKNNILDPTKYNYNNNNNNKNSFIGDLSTNDNTNKDNIFNYEKDDINNKNSISPFNLGSNNISLNSLNFANDLNNNSNKDNLINNNSKNSNIQFSFNPNAFNQNNSNISTNSQLFPANSHYISPNDINNSSNLNYNDNNNDNIQPKNVNYEERNDLNQNQIGQNFDPNNNNNENQNVNKDQNSFNPNNFSMNNNNDNNNNNNNINNKINTNNDLNSNNPPGYYPLDIIEENNKNNKETIVTINENPSLRTSLDYNENNIYDENEKKSKDKKSNALKSLLYGLLFGATATGLFWLRNEDTRNYLWEKLKGINFESIINFFKSLLNPFEFFRKILSEDKKKVYLKVLGITFGKFFDFLEKYGDGFRLLGIFLFVYAIWLVIKYLIRVAIKVWKEHN